MGRRARVIVVGCFASGAAALGACNALTGAGDLRFDESPATGFPDASTADATPARLPTEAGAPPDDGGGMTDADAADAAATACTADPDAKPESVSGTPTGAMDDAKVGSVPWSIGISGGVPAAHATLNNNDLTHYIRAYAFGFSTTLPENVVIRGIQVVVTRTADFPDEVTDYGVVLSKNGLLSGESKTYGTTWESPFNNLRTATYGGATDLWLDPTWGPDDIRSPTFGVALAARGISAALTNIQVTQMTITVTFVRCLMK